MKHKRKGTTYDSFGFSCDVSEREWIDASGQIDDAAHFLAVHSSELRSLTSQYQIDDIRLDFPFESRLSEQVFAQFDYLSPRLVRACAEYGIGIGISYYPPTQGENCEPDTAPNGGSATRLGNSSVTEGPPSVS